MINTPVPPIGSGQNARNCTVSNRMIPAVPVNAPTHISVVVSVVRDGNKSTVNPMKMSAENKAKNQCADES